MQKLLVAALCLCMAQPVMAKKSMDDFKAMSESQQIDYIMNHRKFKITADVLDTLSPEVQEAYKGQHKPTMGKNSDMPMMPMTSAPASSGFYKQ